MKNSIIYVLVISYWRLVHHASKERKYVKLESNIDSVSYAIGVLVGANNLKQLESAPGGDELTEKQWRQLFMHLRW